ncbi:hypothetical protein BH10BAC3_BH10BAC3_41960 [soil metagenome]
MPSNMNTDEIHDEDWDREDEKSNQSRSSRHRRDRKQALEEDIIKVAKDDMLKAREIVMIRKELNRLHYKVKSYHNQTRITNAIVQLVIIALLLVIVYRLYAVDVALMK